MHRVFRSEKNTSSKIRAIVIQRLSDAIYVYFFYSSRRLWCTYVQKSPCLYADTCLLNILGHRVKNYSRWIRIFYFKVTRHTHTHTHIHTHILGFFLKPIYYIEENQTMTNAHIYERVLYGLSKRYVKHSRTYIYLHTHHTHLSSFPIASEREIRISHLNEVAKSAARRAVHAYSRDWFAPLYMHSRHARQKPTPHTHTPAPKFP